MARPNLVSSDRFLIQPWVSVTFYTSINKGDISLHFRDIDTELEVSAQLPPHKIIRADSDTQERTHIFDNSPTEVMN